MKVDQACVCHQCISACKNQPGWFAYGEAEKTAEFLGVSFEEFKKQIILDSCDNWKIDDAAYVWAPRKVGVDRPEDETRSWLSQRTPGRCVFLTEDERCSIHAAKPFECRYTLVCDWKGGNRMATEQTYMDAGNPLGLRPMESED